MDGASPGSSVDPESWPIPDQPNPIPVRVRVVWDGGKEEWIDGLARRWTRESVFVAFSDDRRSTPGVWVKPEECSATVRTSSVSSRVSNTGRVMHLRPSPAVSLRRVPEGAAATSAFHDPLAILGLYRRPYMPSEPATKRFHHTASVNAQSCSR